MENPKNNKEELDNKSLWYLCDANGTLLAIYDVKNGVNFSDLRQKLPKLDLR